MIRNLLAFSIIMLGPACGREDNDTDKNSTPGNDLTTPKYSYYDDVCQFKVQGWANGQPDPASRSCYDPDTVVVTDIRKSEASNGTGWSYKKKILKNTDENQLYRHEIMIPADRKQEFLFLAKYKQWSPKLPTVSHNDTDFVNYADAGGVLTTNPDGSYLLTFVHTTEYLYIRKNNSIYQLSH